MKILENYLEEMREISGQIYSYTDDKGKDHSYYVKDIWKASKGSPTITISTNKFILEEDVWFSKYSVPSPDNILKHTRRILKADLKYPIILDKEFYTPNIIKYGIIDGFHRILKHKLKNITKVKAILFDLNTIKEKKIK